MVAYEIEVKIENSLQKASKDELKTKTLWHYGFKEIEIDNSHRFEKKVKFAIPKQNKQGEKTVSNSEFFEKRKQDELKTKKLLHYGFKEIDNNQCFEKKVKFSVPKQNKQGEKTAVSNSEFFEKKKRKADKDIAFSDNVKRPRDYRRVGRRSFLPEWMRIV